MVPLSFGNPSLMVVLSFHWLEIPLGGNIGSSIEEIIITYKSYFNALKIIKYILKRFKTT